MNISKFTQKSQEAVQLSQKIALENGNQQIDQEHLAAALMEVEDSLIANLVTKMGIQKEAFAGEINTLIGKLPKVSGASGQEYLTVDMNKVLTGAEDEAKAMGDDYVSVEHLFLCMLRNPNRAMKELFRNYGITREKFLQALSTVRGNQRVTSDNPEATYDTLNKYGSDLVERARDQKLDPVIGRDDEIRNVIRILSRKTKNNQITTSVHSIRIPPFGKLLCIYPHITARYAAMSPLSVTPSPLRSPAASSHFLRGDAQSGRVSEAVR